MFQAIWEPLADSSEPQKGHYDFRRPSTRLPGVQLGIASTLGLVTLLAFCILRKTWPQMYAARTARNPELPKLPKTLFGWIPVVFRITDEQVLQLAGLDAYVFLGFFRMSIALLSICFFFGVAVISPVRYHFTGRYDQSEQLEESPDISDPEGEESYEEYLWTYVVFTYVFTLLAVYMLRRQTKLVVKVRQAYLGKQNSITDRTIRLSGIPPELRDEQALKEHIEKLNIGTVSSVTICREWQPLNRLFSQRKRVILKLEDLWSEYLGQTWLNKKDNKLPIVQPRVASIYSMETDPAVDGFEPYHDNADADSEGSSEAGRQFGEDVEATAGAVHVGWTEPSSGAASSAASELGSDVESDLASELGSELGSDVESEYESDRFGSEDATQHLLAGCGVRQSASNATITLGPTLYDYKRPTMRLGWFGLLGKKVDAIDYYTYHLEVLDEEIRKARKRSFPPTPTAFVTMNSVATAQMAAQAVLDPHVHHLISRLAPAPHDIIWDNVCLSRKERLIKGLTITAITSLLSVVLIFPVLYLAALINTRTISKIWPKLGELLQQSPALEVLVTELLPTYLFTFMNIVIPYLYVFLSTRQGFVSHGEEEIAAVGKNFFYIFVNLFLVFTMAGTASNFWGFLSDTTKIAYQLASSLQSLSLFYVDLIILQGIGMFPFKLLQFGALFKYPFFRIGAKTPRDYRNLYRPPVFNFGLLLPQPILVLIITIIYSVISTKILASGLVYFIIGYYVYKYQLIFAQVHPQHSTGKVWPLVFRRVVFGLMIFQLTMAGTLALKHAYFLATLLTPLPLISISVFWDFEKNYIPLSFFIALTAIIDNGETPTPTETPTAEPEDDQEPHSRRYDFITQQIKRHQTMSSRLYRAINKQKSRTLDEVREQYQTYGYPYLLQELEGPWIAVEGDNIVTANTEGTVRKRVKFLEWE